MKMRFLALLQLLATAGLLTPFTRAQAPVFDIMQQGSAVGFNVKASVAIPSKFDKWDSTLTFTSKMSRQAFWASRCSQPVSIPEAA